MPRQTYKGRDPGKQEGTREPGRDKLRELKRDEGTGGATKELERDEGTGERRRSWKGMREQEREEGIGGGGGESTACDGGQVNIIVWCHYIESS